MITVLHIERSNLIIQEVKDVVTSTNNRYISCHNSDDAFHFLNNGDIDLIITAVEIDTHSKKSIINLINESEYSSIPILVFTSTDNMATREQLFDLGIVDYIVKNIDFKSKLAEYLRQFKVKLPIPSEFTKLEIAVLDDSLLSLKIIKNILNNSDFHNVDFYNNPNDLLNCGKTYNIYLLDLVLPERSGESVMLEVRKNHPNAIIILVSMISHFKTISNILVKGADDYIMKPFDENIFLGRLRTHMRSYLLMQELKLKNAYLEELVNKDGLTGLYNHRFIIERLLEEESRMERYDKALSIIMLDIDHFKNINDTYGHPVGDKVLKDVSRVLKENLRVSDVIGRYGGEEFLVILPETDLKEASLVAEKLRFKIETFIFDYFEDHITISGGIGLYKKNQGKNIIVEADHNLYKAKGSGRNRIVSE